MRTEQKFCMYAGESRTVQIEYKAIGPVATLNGITAQQVTSTPRHDDKLTLTNKRAEGSKLKCLVELADDAQAGATWRVRAKADVGDDSPVVVIIIESLG